MAKAKSKAKPKAKPKAAPRLPGDPNASQAVAQMLRVDHAGEYGAVRIYEGQLAVLGKSKAAPVIQHMLDQEKQHLEKFEQLVGERRARPTALLPFWHLAGFALGAGTALLGEKAAMACTVAVEEVIDEHYAEQIADLTAHDEEPELRDTFEAFRQEELAHRQTGLDHGAEAAPGYAALTGAVKAGSRLAIWLSTRI
ncbi:MAG: demethoxyubiquinone hydroxylase family protein [Rhodospirillales bacterium]|nr:demethoxyubiquinone hydroxylase family protein [Rhodospirillales bacterium]